MSLTEAEKRALADARTGQYQDDDDDLTEEERLAQRAAQGLADRKNGQTPDDKNTPAPAPAPTAGDAFAELHRIGELVDGAVGAITGAVEEKLGMEVPKELVSKLRSNITQNRYPEETLAACKANPNSVAEAMILQLVGEMHMGGHVKPKETQSFRTPTTMRGSTAPGVIMDGLKVPSEAIKQLQDAGAPINRATLHEIAKTLQK